MPHPMVTGYCTQGSYGAMGDIAAVWLAAAWYGGASLTASSYAGAVPRRPRAGNRANPAPIVCGTGLRRHKSIGQGPDERTEPRDRKRERQAGPRVRGMVLCMPWV